MRLGWGELRSLGGMSDEVIRSEIAIGLKFRGADTIRDDVNESIAHLTQKAGALLAAQAIFLVVGTWGTDHGWPRLAVVVSIILVVLAALIVMTILRSIYVMAPRAEDPQAYAFEQILAMSKVLSARAARFNVALLMTFLSVILLGFGAVEAAIG
jgi:hypothetical protein